VTRSAGKPAKFSGFPSRGGCYLAVALLGLGLNAVPAAAISTGEVTDTVDSVVAPLTAPPQPPLQGVPQPQAPADPIDSAAGATAPSPGGSTVAGAAGSLGAATHQPSSGSVTNSANELADTAAETPTGAAQHAAPSLHSGLAANRDPDGQAQTSSPGDGKASFQPAKAAPPRRFVAYVWPAIALWPGPRPLSALLAKLTGVDSLAIERAARLLSSPVGSARAPSDSALPAHHPTPNAHNAIPVGTAASLGAKILFYLATAALLAMLALTIRKEWDMAPRLPGRRR
jgi:hypothetical protein